MSPAGAVRDATAAVSGERGVARRSGRWERQQSHARPALWACLAAGFATLFDAVVITYAAPAVSTSLGGSTAGVQWLLASFSLTFGLGLIPSGRLGDVYGRRLLFLVGLAIFLVGGVAAVVAPTIAVLVAARFVQGLGAGVISAQVLGAIQDLFTGRARLSALAAYTAVGGLAGVLGPVLAAAVIVTLSAEVAWRVVLLTPLPLVVAAFVLGWRGMPGPRARPQPSGSERVWLDLPGIVLLCLVVVALLWFGSGMAAGSAVTLYFLQSPALSALVIALVLAPGALARLGGSLFSLRVVARLGSSGTVWLGLGLQAVLFTGLAIAAPLLPSGALIVVTATAQIGLGIGGGLVEPVVRATTLSFAPPELHGVAASFLQLTQRLAATFLVALATGILLTSSGVSTAATLQAALATCAIGSAVALAASADPAFRRAGTRAESVTNPAPI